MPILLPRPISTTPEIEKLLKAGAQVIFNLSGGKDSGAAMLATTAYLDQIEHPKSRRSAIHADLGDIEWPMTGQFVEQIADWFETPLTIVRRRAGGLIDRWYQRFDAAKARYTNLETYCLIGPWSSAKLRFCTSETKVAPIRSHTTKTHRGEQVIHVIGIRREESSSRAKAPISKQDGPQILSWNPILEWTADDVYDAHDRTALPLHPAYRRYGCSRMGCSWCVLSCADNLHGAAKSGLNTAAYQRLTNLEVTSSFSFQPQRWLSDIAREQLNPETRERVNQAKAFASERRAIEATLPPDLRFQKGWPPRVPTHHEATTIAQVRATILAHHNLPNLYPAPSDIIARFTQLHNRLQMAA